MALERLEDEIKALIIEALALEDIAPGGIDEQAPLFGDGLGLDSIDALELGLALHKRYGVKLDDEDGRRHFASVASLAAFVSANLQRQPTELSRAQIDEHVRATLIETFGLDSAKVTPEARLRDDLDLDSIDAIEMVVRLESITGLKLRGQDLTSIRTVKDIGDALVVKLTEKTVTRG